MTESTDDPISQVAAISDPARRRLYDYVVEQGGDVSRDAAAHALGISRSLAAFHLDKLVEEGLLQTTFRRLNGRAGPGAGRPSKLYRRSGRQIRVSLPPRQYELAAQLLVQAVDDVDSPRVREQLAHAARGFGLRVGEETRELPEDGTQDRDVLRDAEDTLAAYGYEPSRVDDGTLRFRNCPFHSLAQSHRSLVCGMNLALMQGVVAGMGLQGVDAVLDPQPGMCCVAFRRREGVAGTAQD